MPNYKTDRVKILGVDFFNGSVQQAVKEIVRGGYMVVPSGPGLVTLPHDSRYAEALIKSDMAIADSRYMVLLWFFFRGQRVKRISGLAFLQDFFNLPDLKTPGELFLVDPSDDEAQANKRYLESIGIFLSPGFSYVAPFYGNTVEDCELVQKLGRLRPKYILLNIGGGAQEKLALYLIENLVYRPAVICTGAAIAFLSGKQAPIPVWVDHVGLGWLWRCFYEPKKFIPRDLSALSLFMLILRFGSAQPLPRQEAR
ncbi:MAG: WecB/TagA/CpsF family glycosyltransferase [Smithellaceae bacterium]|nr:WecB/TagA/CpsF family glycosyltransferase [Smithellaceae bacterium]